MWLKYLLSIYIMPLSLLFADCKAIRIVQTDTQSKQMSNKIAKKLFENAGNAIEIIEAYSPQDAFRLLSKDKADIYMNTWTPLNTDDLLPYALAGEIKTGSLLVANAQIGIASNRVAIEELGLISLEQLSEHGEALNYTIYIGQMDWHLAQRLERVMHGKSYGLKKFKVERVHDYDLRELLKDAENKREPIVFFSRNMSFSKNTFAHHYLYDALNLMGSGFNIEVQRTRI